MQPPQLPYMRHSLRIFGAGTGIAVVVLSLFIFITHSWGSIQGFISRLWNMVFGCLMLAAEVDMDVSRQFLSYLSFLTTDIGRGLFFIFVGTQVLSNPWVDIVIACLAIAAGGFHIMFAMMCEGAQASQTPPAAGKPAEVPPVKPGGAATSANPFSGGGAAAGGESYGSNYGAADPAAPAANAGGAKSDNPFAHKREALDQV